jgi:hypothetical protein
MYTVVYYKTQKAFRDASTKNVDAIAKIIGFAKIIVYKIGVTIKYDLRTIVKIFQANSLDAIPTGDLVILVNDKNEADSFILNKRYKVKKRFDDFSILVLVIPHNTTPENYKDQLEKQSFVDFATIDVYEEVSFTYEFTYDHPIHWYLQNMNSSAAWALMGDYTNGAVVSSEDWVEVAIFDSQIAGYHPELQGKISSYSMHTYADLDPQINVENWTLTPEMFEECPDTSGPAWHHGTGVAGVVAAKNSNNDMILSAGNDKVKVQVIAFYSITSPCQAEYGNSINPVITLAAIINGLNAVYANPKCVAMSFSVFNTLLNDPIAQSVFETLATEKRNGKGIPIFAAMGNSGIVSSVSGFAQNPYITGVIASNALDLKAGFSNYGPVGFIAAPGENIVSLSVPGIYGSNLPLPAPTAYANGKLSVPRDIVNTYQSVLVGNGTSSSSPIAATVAATLMYVNPELTRNQVLDILAETARKTGGSEGYVYTNGRSDELGFGIIDHEAAMQLAIDYANDPLQLPPWYQNLDTGIVLQITNAPNVLDFGIESLNVETLVTLSQEVLAVAATMVIEFWLGLDESFGSTYGVIGSYTIDSLSASIENNNMLFLNCDIIQPVINQRLWACATLYDSNFNILNWPNTGNINKDSVPVTLVNDCTTFNTNRPVSIKYLGMVGLADPGTLADTLLGFNNNLDASCHRVRVKNRTNTTITKMGIGFYINQSIIDVTSRNVYDNGGYTTFVNLSPYEEREIIFIQWWNPVNVSYDPHYDAAYLQSLFPRNVTAKVIDVTLLGSDGAISLGHLNISSTKYIQSWIFS